MGIEIQPPGPGVPPVPSVSANAYGAITAPGAGATVCQIVAPAPGYYQITVLPELSGTITTAEQDNFRLVINGSLFCSIQSQALPTTGVVQQPRTVQAQVPAGNITVTTTGAGGVAATYSASITATRIA